MALYKYLYLFYLFCDRCGLKTWSVEQHRNRHVVVFNTTATDLFHVDGVISIFCPNRFCVIFPKHKSSESKKFPSCRSTGLLESTDHDSKNVVTAIVADFQLKPGPLGAPAEAVGFTLNWSHHLRHHFQIRHQLVVFSSSSFPQRHRQRHNVITILTNLD